MTHKYNFENATEKRQADKEFGYITIPDPDGQWKHPEHLQQHNTLQVLQRETLKENWPVVRKMIAKLPEHQRKDTIHMLKKTNNDPMIGKKFPDEFWFRKRADENETL
jgi:Mn-dependent DtxR family transcriptional regulator